MKTKVYLLFYCVKGTLLSTKIIFVPFTDSTNFAIKTTKIYLDELQCGSIRGTTAIDV